MARPRRGSGSPAPRHPQFDVRALPSGPVPLGEREVRLEVDPDGTGVMLLLDGIESSHLDAVDPTRLMFEYMQQMDVALDAYHPGTAPLRVLHLGAAGCALARAVEARRPDSRQIAVEIDGALAEAVRDWFALPRAPRLRIRTEDARVALEGRPPASADVVIRDAFAGRSVPEHLRTLEFTRAVAAVLAPGGLYLANTADRGSLAIARREAATLAEVFAHVAIAVEPAVQRGRRYGNLVLIGSDAPVPAELSRRLRTLPVPTALLEGAEALAFGAGREPFGDPAPEPAAG